MEMQLWECFSYIQVEIGEYRDVVDLTSKIDSLPGASGTTDIYKALTTMRNMFNANHRFDGKPLKRFIAIVITDGEDTHHAQVQSAASAAHADGIVIISIGKTAYVVICLKPEQTT